MKEPVFIEDTVVVPATVADEVELNSAMPTSNAPVTIKSLVNLPDPDTSNQVFGVVVPIPTSPEAKIVNLASDRDALSAPN